MNTIKNKLEKIYNTFDKGHGMEHINEVVENAIKLNRLLGNPYREDMVSIAALYHDIGISEGRENHEKNSGRMLSEDEDLKKIFNEEEIELMRKACEEHRASYKGEFTSLLSKIINDADSMYTMESVILRSYNYTKQAKGKNNVMEYVYSHLCEKFGYGGYLKFKLDVSNEAPDIIKVKELLKDKEMFTCKYMELTKNETL